MTWQPIETAPLETRVMLWCPERQRKSEQIGVVFGTVVRFSDGELRVYGDGMNGDWLFTHWMPLPEPPAQGIEAATAAETVELGSVHESPVAASEAPKGEFRD